MHRGAAVTGVALPGHIIHEAAGWLLRSGERELAPAELQQLQAWRNQSPDHERAWQAAMELQGLMGRLPPTLGKAVLNRPRADRRTLLKSLAALAITLPAAGMAYRHRHGLTADVSTATGEHHLLRLPDGSQLHLGTATRVNVAFTQQQRLLHLLSGEILVTTAPDPTPSARPFIVQTSTGQIRALGTRFAVRTFEHDITRIDVYSHAVAIRPAQAATETRLESGQGSHFDRYRLHTAYPVRERTPAWARGQLIADNQRLEDFVAELNRYRAGYLYCDPAVADLRISGVFQLDNTDQVLAMVKETLPVCIRRVTDYWVGVLPRQ